MPIDVEETAKAIMALIDEQQQEVVSKPCKKELLCNLTADDIKEKSKELTGEMIDVEDLKRRRKDLGDHIKEKESQILTMRNTIHFQREVRSVDCTENINYNTREVTTIRMDTLEIVNRRGMTKNELQLELPLDDVKPDEEAKPEEESSAIKFEISPLCEHCSGTGMNGLQQCEHCFGSGRADIVRCEECRGTGDDNGTDCATCAGSGWLELEEDEEEDKNNE